VEQFIEQLKQNNVEYEISDYLIKKNTKVLDIPFGESEDGFFMSLLVYFTDDKILHIELECD
jgi:hypothetical protein